MILMIAPAAGMSFGAMPSGATYVSNQYALIFISNNSAADQAALAAAGCYTLSPFGGWGTYGFPSLASLYAADLANNLVMTGQVGFPEYTMAVVYNDATPGNNGTWNKTASGNGTGNWTYLAQIPSSGALAAAASAAAAAAAAGSVAVDATAAAAASTSAGASATAAATSAAAAAAAVLGLPYYPFINASTAAGGSNVLPQGITSGTVGGTAVTGATIGTYPLTATGGSFTGVTANLVVTSATAATIVVTNPGRTTSASPSAPTWANPSGATIPAGTTLTANIGTQIASGGGQYYLTSDVTGAYLLYWQNTGTGAPVAVLGATSAQVSLPLAATVSALVTKSALLYGALNLWPGGMAPAVAIACPDGTAAALLDGQGHLVTPIASGGFERVFSPQNINGTAALNIAPIGGEQIVSVKYDQWNYVRAATGVNGGYFLATPTGLQRANANYFVASPLLKTFTGTNYSSSPVSVALPHKPSQSGTAYIFVGMGQSNYDGQNNNASDPFLSSTAVYASNAFMLQQGSTAGGPRVRTASGAAVLAPLVEQVINAGGGSYQQETPTSGWVNHFISLYNSANGVLPTVVGVSVAIGGRGYVGNGRGQAPLELGLELATTALKAKGFTDIIVVGAWVGSESDTTLAGMDDLWFKRNMRQLRRDFTESCRRICGMQADPEILFIQPDNVINATPNFQPARDGQRTLDNEYGFTLAGTGYDLLRETSSDTTSNYIHRSNLSKYTTGMRLGIATFYQICNNGAWHGIKPTKAYWTSSTVINVEFDGMGVGVSGNALVLDTSGTITTASSTYNNALANYGFSFDDGSGSPPAISTVTVSGYIATITLASAPTGLRKYIGYALARTALSGAPNNINITDGPLYGARGQLRDSVARTRLTDSATEYDWCPAFMINL